MKKKHRMHYYGVLSTYNPYDDKWYAFHKSDMVAYFTDTSSVVYGVGKDALSAMNDYMTKTLNKALS